ncbi:helix-turn-helix transcriptional regulator [Variovorax dokdonensis]|uniref:Helix-turn-helix transcriptional regulator n=1 Tax=Variovorax dokdonensis TaxID=344883 RepID=A0ABT7NE79_9BURK|nr:helix-turn-helix transcriptional regulator [Variovorax dokdonensis]MDM0046239.1 helix-turn-helix transcriptional regulator [Variovorax dokdonensis]
MRKWTPASWRPAGTPAEDSAAMGAAMAAMGAMVGHLGDEAFENQLLAQLHPVLPAASWSVYQFGPASAPQLHMSASLGVPDTTRSCWNAYLSGPCRADRSLRFDDSPVQRTHLCHITAAEVADDHRARVYEAHGMLERLSIVQHDDDDSLFAVNFYRHAHQHELSDAQIGAFEQLAPALLALARKQVSLRAKTVRRPPSPESLRERLASLSPELTARELDVCARLLVGMTQDGIAEDLRLSVPTVKTYRNRAFARLGIHFRNELFALVLPQGGAR